MSGRAVPRKKPTPSSMSRSPASIARPRPANSSTPPSRPQPAAWSPARPWRPSCCANGAASPARPRILGDLFDRLGLRRIRAARLGQQPDGLRLELRRVSRAFCHGSIISHRVRGNAEQKSVHISLPSGLFMEPFRGYVRYEGWNFNVDTWRIVFSVPQGKMR